MLARNRPLQELSDVKPAVMPAGEERQELKVLACLGHRGDAWRGAVSASQSSSTKCALFSSSSRIRQPGITRSSILRNRSLWARSIRWIIS